MDHPSVWMAGRTPAVPPPEGRVDTAPLEVLILGGGLCGLLTAFRLYEKGVRAMAVLEAADDPFWSDPDTAWTSRAVWSGQDFQPDHAI